MLHKLLIQFKGTQTTTFGDRLSDHNPVEFEFEFFQESETTSTAPTTSTSGAMIESSSGSEVNSTAVAIAVPTVVGDAFFVSFG